MNPDEQIATLLDDYLRQLQRGDGNRQKFVHDHPELKKYFECLEALDQLPPTTSNPPTSDSDHISTVVIGTNEQQAPVANPDTVQPCAERSFGKYQLLEELGRGGMGIVFKAHDKSLDRIVAIKMILSSQLVDESQIIRFQVEARAAAQLQHRNIVAIHDAGQIAGQHFFCMEYVPQSLDQRIRSGTVTAEEAACIVCKIAHAVEYLHQKGIIHRDLKPSNILLDEEGEPYVTDFGLAKIFASDSHLTQTGTIAGTPSYMAPEQASGKTSQVDNASDIYSLGAVLYELLTGRPPFRGETPLETLVQVLESEPVAPRQWNRAVPVDLQRICLHCLEKSPSDRYQSAAELAADLERFLRGEELAITSQGWTRRLRNWARRKPALASRLAAFGTFAAVLQLNYHYLAAPGYLGYHLTVMFILAAGAAGAFFFQRLLDSERWSEWGRAGWAGFDLAITTAALVHVVVQDVFPGPLLIAYPLIMVASGLWFREQIVGLVTAGSILSFGALLLLSKEPIERYHHYALYAISLGVLGFMVGFQVKRVRALSQYYERRPLP